MKNVDVPIWDKGDDTDNYTKGGASSPSRTFSQMAKLDKTILSVFKLILGRKPTTRENAYYRITKSPKEEMIMKLVNSPEHKELVTNGRKYPDLLKEKKGLETTILKLKSNIEDFKGEYDQLQKLLEQKNQLIKELRENKDKPYLTDRRLLEEDKYSDREAARRRYQDSSEDSLWDKILKLFFK